MIEHRILNLEERKTFRTHYESFGVGTISDDYLENSIVRGFFDKTGKMVGGHIVNKIGSKSRYLSFIPNRTRVKLPISTESIAEICCVWMDKKLKNQNLRLFMYLQGLLDAKSTKSKFVIAGTTNEKNKLVQSFVFPKKLWDGIATHGSVQYIHYTEVEKLISNWVTAIPKYHFYKSYRKVSKLITSRIK